MKVGFFCFAVFVFALAIFLAFLVPVRALPTGVDSVSLGVSVNQVVDERDWGVLGAAPFQFRGLDGYAAAQLQGGDIIRGKWHAEVSRFGAILYADGFVKGYEITGLGGQTDVGLAFQLPSVRGADVRVGVFGRNAGPFAVPDGYSVLESANFDPDVLDGIQGLSEIRPRARGFSFEQGASLNVLVATGFEGEGASVSVKFMRELTLDAALNQLMLSFFVSRALVNRVSVDAGFDVGFQNFEETLERETATYLGLSVDF